MLGVGYRWLLLDGRLRRDDHRTSREESVERLDHRVRIGGAFQYGQWTFLVFNEKNDADPDQGDTTITVTVMNPDKGESTTTTPPPQSPPITLAEVL